MESIAHPKCLSLCHGMEATCWGRGTESSWMSAYSRMHHPLTSVIAAFSSPSLSHLCLQSSTTKPHRISFPHIQEAQVVLIPSLVLQCLWRTGDERGGASAHAVRMNALIWMSVSYMSVVSVVLLCLFEYSCHLLQRLFSFIVTAIQTAECSHLSVYLCIIFCILHSTDSLTISLQMCMLM